MFILRFTSHQDQSKWYFQNLGDQWPGRPACRLIERTTQDINHARQFATEQEAKDILSIAGGPKNWEIVPKL
jgi:hypothetical protein